jgi:hypothetical protein
MVVHNDSETEALISIFLNSCLTDNSRWDYIILENKQLKTPHNLTATDWMIKIILEKDRLLNNYKEYNLDDYLKKEIDKISEQLNSEYKKIKIKGF